VISRKYDAFATAIVNNRAPCVYSEHFWSYYGSRNDNPGAYTMRFVAWTRLVIVKREFFFREQIATRTVHSALVSRVSACSLYVANVYHLDFYFFSVLKVLFVIKMWCLHLCAHLFIFYGI